MNQHEACSMKGEPFENVRNQIGFCGIWCGSCAVGNGVLRELTRRYEQTIKRYGLEEWAPEDFDFEEFTRGLASIQAMPLCRGCLKGDGKPNCEIRACALKASVTRLRNARTLKYCRKCAQVRAKQVFWSRLRTLIDKNS